MTALALMEDFTLAKPQFDEVDIDSIQIGERFRKEMGDIATLSKSIRDIGLLQPVVVDGDDNLVAGERRIRAVQALGWSRIPVRRINIDALVGEHDENEIREAFRPSERVAIARAVEERLGARQGQRTDLELPQNIAEVAGKETRTIAAEKAGFGNAETYRQAKAVTEKGAPELVSALDEGRISISAASEVLRLPREEQVSVVALPEKDIATVAAGLRRERSASNDNSPTTRLASYSGDNEWYTPAKYIEMARDVLGAIDVDPASNDHAQQTVKATTYYTAQTNGLDKQWVGKVWMNPPYSNPEIQHFAAKVIKEFKEGRTTEAIVLTNNAGDTGWHHALCDVATCWCITKGRIRFESLTRESGAGAMGQVFFYFGGNPQKFKDVFSSVGRVDHAL